MALFDFLKSGRPKKYVAAKDYEANRDNQSRLTPQTLEQLRNHDVRDESQLKLEFFFYTNAESKAEGLVLELSDLGYTADYEVAASNKKEFVINGWTNPIQMTDAKVLEWTRSMCEIGYKHDCEFDGWGTDPA
jgi:hypothetical protein